jgi:ABC-2 type transport system permease protein
MKAWVLARKDLKVYFRDRAAVALGFGLPIALCTVFGGAMGAIGGGDSIGRVELVLEDLDRSEASRALIAELERTDGLRLDVLASEGAQASTDGARERVLEGDAPAGLRIGAGFAQALEEGAELPLTLYRDPGKTIEQQILAGNLIPAFVAVLGDHVGKRMGARLLDTLDFPALGRERAQEILDGSWARMESLVEELHARGALADGESASSAEDAVAEEDAAEQDASEDEGETDFDFASGAAEILGIEIEDVVGGDQEQAAQRQAQQTQAVAGMAVMMLLFGLIHCGGTLLEEQHSGTLDRLRLAPGAANAVLGGKMLFTWIVGSLQLVVLFLYGNLVFDVPIFRSPLALVVLSAVTAAAVTGFGILFAVVCRSKAQLEGLSTLVVLTMSALGGSWFPLAITPEWYRFLGHFTLNAWAMDGYQGLFWYGKGLLGILPEIGVLAGIALGTSFLAWRLWERRMRV